MPAFTAVPTAAAVCATGAVPVFADVDPDTATLDPAAAAAAVTGRTRAVIPVHLYGRPAALPDLGVPVLEDAAQALGALDPASGSAAVACSFYPTKNLGGICDGGAVLTDDDDLAATIRLLRVHGLTDDYVHTHVVDQRPAVGDRGRRPARGAALVGRRQPAPRVDRRPLPRGRAGPAVAGARSAARVPPLRGAGARPRRVPRTRAVRHRRALPAGAHAATCIRGLRRDSLSGGRGVGGRVRVAAVLSRDDRRRDRGGVSSTPVNPAVTAVSVFFPCYNDEATIGSMVSVAVATLERVGVTDAEVIVIDDGSTDQSPEVLAKLAARAAPAACRHAPAEPRVRRRADLRLRRRHPAVGLLHRR